MEALYKKLGKCQRQNYKKQGENRYTYKKLKESRRLI